MVQTFPAALRDVPSVISPVANFVMKTKRQRNMKTKSYDEMTAAEQLHWVLDFSEFANNQMPVLMNLRGTWSPEHRKMMERGLQLLTAFPFALEYAETALRFGDYDRRTYRLPYYVDGIKEKISANVVVRDAGGNAFAYVPQMKQTQRRRGRPTREEAYQWQMMMASGQSDDMETEKQQAIARMLGLEVVTNPTGREKNNEEMRTEREAKAAREAKMNPGLFAEEEKSKAQGEGGDGKAAAYGEPTTTPPSTIAAMSQARLHLDQLSWLLSPELKERVAAIADLRSTAASYAEQAKVMAERGDKAEVVEPVAQLAAKYTELYEKIYEDVDVELATVCYRLKNDEPFAQRFMKRFGVKDPSDIIRELKPYLSKMPPEFEVRVKAIIEHESPEYIAKVKAEKARKQEVDAILKYLRRKDKTATKKRVETSEKKFERLAQLIGDEQAEIYRPILTAIQEEYKNSTAAKPLHTENG